MATPATAALIGTPASIIDRLLPHTLAIELEPLDSRISETMRITYGKRRHVRHHRVHTAAGQIAMADFATLGRAHHAGLANRERRKVVMQHERFAPLAFERIDDLRIAGGAERGGDHAWVSPRVNSAEPWRAAARRPSLRSVARSQIAPVNARLTGQDALANDATFELEQLADHGIGLPLVGLESVSALVRSFLISLIARCAAFSR